MHNILWAKTRAPPLYRLYSKSIDKFQSLNHKLNVHCIFVRQSTLMERSAISILGLRVNESHLRGAGFVPSYE